MVSYEEHLRVALMAAKEAGDALSLIQNGLLQTIFQKLHSWCFLLEFEPLAGAVIKESFYKDKNVEHKGSHHPLKSLALDKFCQ